MGAYIIKRLLQMIPVLLVVTMLVFSMIFLAGNPVYALVGEGESLDDEQLAAISHELGLDKPIPVQYAMWLGKVIQGDFGRSNRSKCLVIDELTVRLPITLQLGAFAWLISIIIAIPAGIVAAVRHGSKSDTFATAMTVGGVAVPDFWLGMMLILLIGVGLRWLPTYGFVQFTDNPINWLKHLVLPGLSLGMPMAALNMRQTRSAMLEVLAQDYVRTARAKGLRERSVVLGHAFKNALLPVVTVMGLQIGRIFGGAVIIETLFAIPGMGRLMVSSILMQDFPIVQACVLVVAIAVLLANLGADLLYAYLDPRIKYI
ncbi:MAG: ABC transporter permease [Dehalococcoidales bacterium]|nr:ABC transporter permease [Dehalococcoidales bacterium]